MLVKIAINFDSSVTCRDELLDNLMEVKGVYKASVMP